MPAGAALSEGSSGEQISHFTGIRVRVNGTGNLKLAVYSLDDIRNNTLLPLVMATLTERIPTRLCNFVAQRAQFEGKTTEIDEVFRINRIVIFTKPIYTSYPG